MYRIHQKARKPKEMKDSGDFERQPEAWVGQAMPRPGWPARHPENGGKA